MEIRASLAGEKVRRFFPTEAEAFEAGDDLTGQIRQHGVASLDGAGMTVKAAVRRFWAMRGPSIKGRVHRGHIAFPNQRNFYSSLRAAVAQTSLGRLPQNALRHSRFTYHLAKFKNAAEAAVEGGNSEAMVRKVYALPAKRANQVAFWQI